MQEPDSMQRNWLDGSHVVVAKSGKDKLICVVLYLETAFAFIYILREVKVLTTLLLIAHVSAVVVAVTLPDAADAAAVRAAVLVGQTAVL